MAGQESGPRRVDAPDGEGPRFPGAFRGRDGPPGGWGLVAGAVLLLALVAGVAWLWLASPAEAPRAVVDTGARRTVAASEPVLELPELEASDAFVRRLTAALSSRAGWAAWLANDRLVRRFVGATVSVAAGRSPVEELEFLEPEAPFRVRDPEGASTEEPTVVDPASYRRYDLAADVLTSLDARGTAELYRKLRPLFQQAYRDLGFRRGSFDATLARAVDHLLAVPVPDGPVRVVPDGGESYAYLDPALEGLTPAQKHLLRMGPENARRIQAKLRELSDALGLLSLRTRSG